MNQPGQEAIARLGSTELKHVTKAARFQDAPDLAQRFPLRVLLDVVEHKGGEDSIKKRLRIRKRIRISLIELDGNPCVFRLASCPCKRPWVRIEPDNIDVRIKMLDQHDQAAGSAADVENAVGGPDSRLIEERPSDSIAAEQLHERVVKRQKQVVPGRGKISLFRFFNCLGFSRHGFLSNGSGGSPSKTLYAT